MKFFGRIAIGVAASAVLTPPVAMTIGAYTFYTAKFMEYMVEEEDREACKFISNCAQDIALCGLSDALIGVNSSSKEFTLINNESNEKITEKAISLGKEIYDNKKYLNPLISSIKHKKHLNKGIEFIQDCEVCNV